MINPYQCLCYRLFPTALQLKTAMPMAAQQDQQHLYQKCWWAKPDTASTGCEDPANTEGLATPAQRRGTVLATPVPGY